MANRRISDLQEIAGVGLNEADLIPVVQVNEVDPALKNKKLTISGTKAYLNYYYLPLTGGTVSGSVTIQNDLTVNNNLVVSGITANNSVTVSGLIVKQNATVTGTISGNTITGEYVLGTNVNGVTITAAQTVTGATGSFTSGQFQFLSGGTVTGNTVNTTTVTGIFGVFTGSISGAVVTGDTGRFSVISGISGTFTSGFFTSLLSGATITGATGRFSTLTGISGTFTTRVSGATVTGNTLLVSNATGVSGTFTTRVSGATVTGDNANFTSGTFQFLTAVNQSFGSSTVSGSFTVLSGLFVSGSGYFASGISVTGTVSGQTLTGTLVSATTVNAQYGNFLYLTGDTTTGITANFYTLSGTTITGESGKIVSLTGKTAGFTTITGTTVTGTTANFVSGTFTSRISGAVITGDTANFVTTTIATGIFASGSVTAPSITFTGNTDTGFYNNASGGVSLATSGTLRWRVDNAGRMLIGSGAGSLGGSYALVLNRDYTGSADNAYINAAPDIKSDITTARLYRSSPTLDSTGTFTLGALVHYAATPGSFGTGNTVTNQFGFQANSAITGATNNYGFRSDISSGTGRYNFYSFGTADSQFNSSNFIFSPGGTEKIRVNNNGILIAGSSTAHAIDGIYTRQIQSHSTTAADEGLAVVNWGTGINAACIDFAKSKSGSIGTYALPNADDNIGRLRFYMADGVSSFKQGAAILAVTDGTPSATSSAARLDFSTTASGYTSPIIRLRIDSDGMISCGFNATSGVARSTTLPTKFRTSTAGFTDTTTAESGTVAHVTSVTFANHAFIAANSGVTYTNASTVYIQGAPTAGTNATISNAYALYVAANPSYFAGTTLIGTPTSRGIGFSVGSLLQLETGGQAASFTRNSNDTTGAQIAFGKSRGTAASGIATVVSGDQLAQLRFAGADGTNLESVGAQILVSVDNTVASGSVPARIAFATTTSGGTTPVERMRITSSGQVLIATTSAANNADLQIFNTNNNWGSTSRIISASTTYGTGVQIANGITTTLNTAASGIITDAYHFVVNQGTFNTVPTNQFGFHVGASVTGATNNYAFYGNLASGTGRWNFYANGTADNYFGGRTTFGLPATFASGDSAAPGIAFTAGTGNGFFYTVGGGFGISTAGSEKARFDSTGRLLVGTSTALTNTYLGATAVAPQLQIEGNNGSTSALSITRQTGAASNLILQRGITGTPVVSGDSVGQINFNGFDGTNFKNAAQITAQIDNTPGTDDIPGRLIFSTTTDGSATSTERMRITSSGFVGIGTLVPTATLHVGGAAIITSGITSSGAITISSGLTVTGAISCASGITSTSKSGGVGYATGAGSGVTQTTSRTQGVTINSVCGAVTLVSAAGTTAWQSFTVTNSAVATTDTIIVNQKSGTDLYEIHVTNVGAGTFQLTYRTTAGTTTEQPVFNFSVIKAVAA